MVTAADQTVFIVDDDAAIRDSLSLLLGLKGFRTALFNSAEDFLASLRKEWRGCLLLDIKMGGISGLDLQGKLKAQGVDLPIVQYGGWLIGFARRRIHSARNKARERLPQRAMCASKFVK